MVKNAILEAAAHAAVAKISDELVERAYVAIPQFLPDSLARELASESDRLAQDGSFRKARIGRSSDLKTDTTIRSDEILWFEPDALSPAQTAVWQMLETLRLGLNETLYLGLGDFEAHYARYDVGTTYDKHVDRFSSDDARTISLVLYLNQNWQPSDGGKLMLYPDGAPAVAIAPTLGTLVCFLSAEIQHEVLPSPTRTRLSIAAWFRKTKSPLD